MRISELVFPRPVVLLGVSAGKKANFMTVSFISPISFEPKILGVSISPKRYSFELLKINDYFSINTCSKEMLDKAVLCGTHSGRDVDKTELAGLDVEFKDGVPVLNNSPISLVCRKIDMKEYGDHYWVVGEVTEELIRYNTYDPLLHGTGGLFYTVKKLGD